MQGDFGNRKLSKQLSTISKSLGNLFLEVNAFYSNMNSSINRVESKLSQNSRDIQCIKENLNLLNEKINLSSKQRNSFRFRKPGNSKGFKFDSKEQDCCQTPRKKRVSNKTPQESINVFRTLTESEIVSKKSSIKSNDLKHSLKHLQHDLDFSRKSSGLDLEQCRGFNVENSLMDHIKTPKKHSRQTVTLKKYSDFNPNVLKGE